MKLLKIWKCKACNTEFGEVGSYYDFYDQSGKLQKACPMNRCDGILELIEETLS